MLSDNAIKMIEADGAYGIRRLIVEIEDLKMQNSFLESENKLLKEKYRQALEGVLQNLRSIEGPNPADEYIDDSIKVIIEVLKEEKIEK